MVMVRLVAVAGNSCYKVVNSALDNVLVIGSEIFIDFSIKRGDRKLPQSFSLVDVDAPNNKAPPLSAALTIVFALTKIF